MQEHQKTLCLRLQTFKIGAAGDNTRAVYLLSGIKIYGGDDTLNGGKTKINIRNWNIYKDQRQIELIDSVHIMTYEDAINLTGSESSTSDIRRTTGETYWLASVEPYRNKTSVSYYHHLWRILTSGEIWYSDYGYDDYQHCLGIRPVVTMVDGVYISGGSGTEQDPYILAKE